VALPNAGHAPVTEVPLGVKYARVAFDSYQPYLDKLGGGGTFYEAVWCDVEPTEGTRDWSELDEVADQAKAVGQELMLKIRVGSCWATGGQIGEKRGLKGKTASASPVDMAKYDDFVKALVDRYGTRGVKEWAIENEVNSPDMWAGTMAQYADLVGHAATVVREAQPDAIVLDSGVSSPTMGTGVVTSLLRAGKDQEAYDAYERYYARRHTTRAKDYPDVSSIDELKQLAETDKWKHNEDVIGTTLKLANDGVIDRLQLHFYERWDAAPLLMSFVRSSIPADLPVEAWEVGLFDVDDSMSEAQLSDEVSKTVSQLLAYGAARVLWLPLAADPNGNGSDEKRFGLLEPDGTPRLAASVYEELSRISTGASLSRLDEGGLLGFVARRGGQATVVAWAQDGSVQADWAGASRPLDGASTTSGPTTIGSSPIVVDVPMSKADQLAAPG
jgi:hypothetical protein